MGGLGSGRTGGTPTANAAKIIDLAWMIRMGRAKPGQWVSGGLSWNWSGSPAGSISYVANMEDASARDQLVQLVRCRLATIPRLGVTDASLAQLGRVDARKADFVPPND